MFKLHSFPQKSLTAIKIYCFISHLIGFNLNLPWTQQRYSQLRRLQVFHNLDLILSKACPGSHLKNLIESFFSR